MGRKADRTDHFEVFTRRDVPQSSSESDEQLPARMRRQPHARSGHSAGERLQDRALQRHHHQQLVGRIALFTEDLHVHWLRRHQYRPRGRLADGCSKRRR